MFLSEEATLGGGVRLRRVEVVFHRDEGGLIPDGDGVRLLFEYRGVSCYAFLAREVLDDIGRTSYRTFAERAEVVKAQIAVFQSAIIAKLEAANARARRVVISHEDLPPELF